MAKAKAKDEKRWYEENVSFEDSDSASEEEDGDDWMVNRTIDDDEGAYHTLDDSMDDWIEFSNEERPRPFLSKHSESSKAIYDFVDNGEAENYVQASIDNNSCLNDIERANCARELIEEEGNDRGEACDTMIERMQERTSKHFKDAELEIRNVQNSTMGKALL